VTALGPAPTDADGFDAWARAGSDGWLSDEVMQTALARWEDRSLSPSQRALAAIWANPSGEPSGDELAEIAADPDISPALQARLQALVALEQVATDPERATATATGALSTLSEQEVATRTRLGVWLAGAEVLARAGRPEQAVELLTRAGSAMVEATDAPPWGRSVIEAERLAILAPVSSEPMPVVAAARAVANDALALEMSPPVCDVIVKMAGLLVSLGAGAFAEAWLEPILEHTDGVTGAIGMRFQALMVLADIRMSEDPEAAMVVQRRAVDLMSPLGQTPMLGWARRGLGFQLRAAERFDESAAEFDRAAESLQACSMPLDAAVMRLEQAGSLLLGHEPDRAETLALSVLAGLGELQGVQRQVVELQATQLLAQAATVQDSPGQAADRWLHVAELAEAAGASPLEARIAAGQLLAQSGDLTGSLALFDRAEVDAADHDEPSLATAAVLGQRAEVLAVAEFHYDAAELARIAANHARSGEDERQAIHLTLFAAEQMAASGDAGAAEPIAREGLEAAEEAKAVALVSRARRILAEVLTTLGREDEAADYTGG